jgi:Lrp/AsnC family leucine-responsive transcriptional regulator
MRKTPDNKSLDELNWNILQELSENARISNAEFGRRIGLSSPAVAERIQKMEEQGIITGSSMLLDFDTIGFTIRAFINFTAGTMKHDAMVKLFDSIPGIIEWHAVTGNVTMVLKVAVATSRELEDIVGKLMEHGETSTSLILSASKKIRVLERIQNR